MVVPAVALAHPAGAAKGGNSANAKACQKDGWKNWVREDQTPFANQDECVSYGAKGGTLTVPNPTYVGQCYNAPFPDLADIKLTALIDTANNVTVFNSSDGTCQGAFDTRTLVSAPDDASADAKCVTLDPSNPNAVNLSGAYPLPEPDWYGCLPA